MGTRETSDPAPGKHKHRHIVGLAAARQANQVGIKP